MRTGISAIALLLAPVSGAQAQQFKPRPEKYSTRPVQSPLLPPEIMGSKLYVYSRWAKFCGKDKNDPAAQEICLTVMEVKRQAGSFAAGVALMESETGKRLFRITLPADVKRDAGARIAVDTDKSRSGKFVGCTPRGCLADFQAGGQLIARLKTGEVLHLHGTGEKGQAVSFRLPLEGFAAANEGSPSTLR